MYKTVQINYCRKVFCVTAYPCVSTSVPLTYIRVSIRVRGLHLVFVCVCTSFLLLAMIILPEFKLPRRSNRWQRSWQSTAIPLEWMLCLRQFHLLSLQEKTKHSGSVTGYITHTNTVRRRVVGCGRCWQFLSGFSCTREPGHR